MTTSLASINIHPFVGLGFAVVVCSFVFSAVLTAAVRKFSIGLNFVARPSDDRYHRSIIPLGGGIAIFWTVTFFLIMAMVSVRMGAAGWFGQSVEENVSGFLSKTNELSVVLIVTLVLHITGLIDDRRSLGPGIKFAVQFAVAAAVAVFADIRVELFIESRIVTTILSVFWIVLVMNAFNFLDNMDGLSAGIATIVTGVLLATAVSSGQIFISAMCLILIGAMTGFLFFNFPPAKIFMGDCGSLIIGFYVALLTLRTTYYHQDQSGGLYSVFMPLIILAVPLYDFISVTFLRLRQGKSPFVGDTQHFSHRMKRRGLTDLQTVLTIYLTTLCTAVGAVLLPAADLIGAILIFSQTMMILSIIAILEYSHGSGNNKSGQS